MMSEGVWLFFWVAIIIGGAIEWNPPRLRMCDETWDIVHQLIRPRALRPCARYMPRSGSRHIHVRVRLALNLVVSGRDARSQSSFCQRHRLAELRGAAFARSHLRV